MGKVGLTTAPKVPSMSRQILRFTTNITEAEAEIRACGGRVTHRFGQHAMVAQVSNELDINCLAKSTDEPLEALDPPTELAVKAWKLSQAKQDEKLDTEGLPWDSPGYRPPAYDEQENDKHSQL